jgi:membrane associated rhomboid family serine protease
MKTEKIKIVFALVLAMWVIFFLDLILSLHLNSYGIIPRTGRGLIGIVTSPFLHATVYHLIGNTLPLLVLGVLLVSFYDQIAIQVLALIALVGGSLVWLFGRSANHIGASGLIYGTATFLITYGIMKKKIVSILIALVVIFLYGGTMVTGILPLNRYVSWEGHLFNALAGVLAAKTYNKK